MGVMPDTVKVIAVFVIAGVGAFDIVNLLLKLVFLFFQVVSPKGLQRSCLKALSPLQIVPSTIWRNAISLGNGCRP